jgi:hypothetical protein
MGGEMAMRANSSTEKNNDEKFMMMSAISITEENEEDDIGDVSENMILPQTPSPRVINFMREQ